MLGAAILPIYLALSIFIGWLARHRAHARPFLSANRSLPLWMVVASILASNCGALEVIGLSGVAAQYGVQAFHFYWIGAIPGMIFLGGVMLPFYVRSGIGSLPEYLERRFDARVRLMNAVLLLATVTALSGVGLYAMARILHAVFAWPLFASTLLAASAVLIYTQIGGIRGTIYNEVLQLVVIVAGLVPLLWMAKGPFSSAALPTGTRGHLWSSLSAVSPGAAFDEFGLVVGLGFVLSFSYWCTDFVQMQRALATRTVAESRLVPLLAGFGKLGFSFLVVIPSLSFAATRIRGPRVSLDETLPLLMVSSFGPILLGLGLTALLASLMASLGANITAFSSLWMLEIYPKLPCRATVVHDEISSSRITLAGAVLLGIATSILAFQFHSLMEYIQLIFSLFSAPFFAVFLAGIFSRRANATGALWGLSCGVMTAAVYNCLVLTGAIVHGSRLSTSFYVAPLAFVCALFVTFLMSSRSTVKGETSLAGLVSSSAAIRADLSGQPLWWLLTGLLLAAFVSLNYLWR
jgi:solute:Na+ symporter, SSS family